MLMLRDRDKQENGNFSFFPIRFMLNVRSYGKHSMEIEKYLRTAHRCTIFSSRLLSLTNWRTNVYIQNILFLSLLLLEEEFLIFMVKKKVYEFHERRDFNVYTYKAVDVCLYLLFPHSLYAPTAILILWEQIYTYLFAFKLSFLHTFISNILILICWLLFVCRSRKGKYYYFFIHFPLTSTFFCQTLILTLILFIYYEFYFPIIIIYVIIH